MLGKTVSHYKILEKLGEGGMGAVYAAEDLKLHRKIALKVLPEEMAASPERIARFQREAQVVAALNHPHIVTLHSVEEAEGIHFITMELVAGRTLASDLPRDGYPLKKLLEVAIPLADAVSAAHRAGITHRDLKPDNIMIDTGGRLRVLDFGLAKLHDLPSPEAETLIAGAQTREGTIVGTVAYMSPEQAEGKPVDPRSDIFSLGTILFELATGKRPFTGETNMSTIGAILKDDPAPVTEIKPALPRHLGRVVRRCLAKDPDRRYQTATDLRIELEGIKEEISSGGFDATPVARAGGRSRMWRWLGLAGFLAAAGTATILLLRGGGAPAPEIYVPHLITSDIGQEADINWSPSSDFLAFGQTRNGSMDVMVQPVVGGGAVLRAGGPGSETCPRWSPDGKFLAYVSSSYDGTPVFLMPPHGGTPRELIATNMRTLDVDKIGTAMGDRPWSPDSRTLLVSRFDETGRSGIYRVNRDDGQTERLTAPPPGSVDLSPTYTFDGQRIAFQRRTNGKGNLLVMPAEGGQAEVLLDDDFDNVLPAWRPDGRRMLFISDRRGQGGTDVWEMDLDSAKLRQLTFETNRVISLSVSADDRIAYVPFWHDTFLFTVDAATGERHQITYHTQDNYGARFAPDDRSVLYHSTRTGNCEIWLHYLDGRPEMQITDFSSWDIYPDWSPDGERMIFTSDREGPFFKLFIANRDGGSARVLVDTPISLVSQFAPVIGNLVCRWSPDGKQVAYMVEGENTQALWSVSVADGQQHKLLEGITEFDWYRDSEHGIYSRYQGSQSELVAVNLVTGEERSLFTGPFLEIDVAPDGHAVAFCHGQGHMAMGLAVLELNPPTDDSGLPTVAEPLRYVVPTTGTWHIHNGGWSADSRQIVYTRDMDYGDVFELVKK